MTYIDSIPSQTEPDLTYIDKQELQRLREVERAARFALDTLGDDGHLSVTAEGSLRAALSGASS